MSVYFSNSGELDLDVIRTMGVSVKDGSNPIGYFGTGLKYALATLLRTGHHISLQNGDRTVHFGTIKKTIRGEEFEIVTMDGEQLGFTTDLGKNWEVWHAYRELASNAMDEGGRVTGAFEEADVQFCVTGPEISEVHQRRGDIFLMSEPFAIADGVEIHRGRSRFLFYRGVRVYQLPKETAFTYNFTCDMRLTEDRTLASLFDANYKLATRLPRSEDPSFASKVVNPEGGHYELSLEFGDCWDPSEEFLDALQKYKNNAKMSENHRKLLMNKRPSTDEYDIMKLDDQQQALVAEACQMLRVVNCIVRPEELTFVEHLGPNVYAAVKGGKMLITRQCIANGLDFTAITIYEEWIHDCMGYADESRGMQQFLFDKILELVKREI